MFFLLCVCVLIFLLVPSENGDPDKERGVHAPFPVASFPRQWHLLDCLRTHPLRPLHHRKLLYSTCYTVYILNNVLIDDTSRRDGLI